ALGEGRLCGRGVDARVPFAGLGGVAALLERSAHPDQLPKPAPKIDPLADRRAEIGERSQGDDGDVAGMALDVRPDVAGRRNRRELGLAEGSVLAPQLD